MADDDTGVTSSPWGRSRRTPGQPTPAPGATPPPGPPSSAPPGTPAPPFSLEKPADPADLEATTVAPPGQWSSPPTSPPGYGPSGSAQPGYGGTPPPPGYPPGGYPPGGPVPARKGSGVVVALVAVGVVALVVVGAVVALVLLSGGDDEDPDRTSASSVSAPTSAVPGSGDPGSTELPASTDDPGSTEAPGSTDAPASTDSVPVPSIPSVDPSTVGPPPEDFPVPPGARDSVTGGIEVLETTIQELVDFYVAELPAAGYTTGDVIDLTDTSVIPVSGNGVQGSLTIVFLDSLPTTVLWVPG